MKRNVLHVLVIWLVLSAAGIVGVVNADLLPATAALQGEIVDQAFRLLLVLAVPVAAFVLTMLGYSLLRFRAGDGDEEEGPALYSNRSLALSWFAITTALAVFVVFNPGLKGLRELAAAESDDALVIQVEGEQWHWNVTYPQHNLSYERALQIAVPVDTPVRFEITSADVIHSFWVPAFRMKMDAVPGKVTTLHVTADELGSFEDDPNLRVQCAELCGTGHPRMQMGVRVLEQAEFEEWVQAVQAVTGDGMDMSSEMDMEGDTNTGGEMDMEGGMDMQPGEEGHNDANMDMHDDQ